jgi:cytochrome c553
MSKKCIGITMFLCLVIVVGIYKFIFQGNVSEGSDGRTTIHLNAGERDLVLAEMRAFLMSVQQITEGISDNDMKRIAEYSRKVGKAAQAEVPGTLMAKLPLQFKQLGFDTHTKFDQLAMDAVDMGDGQHLMSQLALLLQNCVACHAAFRIDLSDE